MTNSKKSEKLKFFLNKSISNTVDLAESKSPKSKCIPARRKIASGGKAGSYADARTGGKQAYAALKKAKPPGSKGGWTKSKCICCHKCKNDRSAPNGFVCTNPAHLYWGTKADNTYDQNRGNGWAAKNKNKNESSIEKDSNHDILINENSIRKLIKSIINENTDIFGKEFLKFKSAYNKGIDPLAYANKNLVKLGEGSTRVVFGFRDNPTMILKVINSDAPISDEIFLGSDGNALSQFDEEGRPRSKHGFFQKHMKQSNQWEADLNMQQKYPNVFPKTYEHAKDFSWILAEKASTLKDNDIDKLFSLLGVKREKFDLLKSYQSKKKDLLRLINDAMNYFKNPDHRLRKMNEASETIGIDFSDQEGIGDTYKGSIFSIPAGDVEYDTEKIFPARFSKEDKELRNLIFDRHNRQLIAAMADLGVPAREFLPKNLGISEITGKLLLIDASLWNEYKPVRE